MTEAEPPGEEGEESGERMGGKRGEGGWEGKECRGGEEREGGERQIER